MREKIRILLSDRRHFSSTSGFTLIELIIVITIIGILASILMANFMTVRGKTRDAVRKKDTEQIRLALEAYRSDAGTYPTSLPACGGQLTFGTSPNQVVYMEKIPCDPLKGTSYNYNTASPYTTYTVWTCIENSNDQGENTAVDTTNCSTTNSWGGRKYSVKNP